MQRSHTRQNEPEKILLLQAQLAEALAPAGHAWVQFLLDCYASDLERGYQAFWSGPVWFLNELGPPFINEAGRKFETDLWITSLRNDSWGQSVWEQHSAAVFESQACDLLNPLTRTYDFETDGKPLLGADHRALAHVMRLLERENRHYQFEIQAQCQNAACNLLALGVHTPEPLYGARGAAAAPQPARNPQLPLICDNNYWFEKYAPPIVFGSEPKELMSRRWKSVLMPLLAPEFVLDRSLSAPRSFAYVLQAEGDWVWAILADTVDQLNMTPPELALLRRTGKKRNKEVTLWQPPAGLWIEGSWATVILVRAVRGIEVNLMWLVRHFKRLIRFYEPLLIPFFAYRGETLLPAKLKE